MSKTNLAISIETTDEKIRRYNENVCTMLADPQVLAYILVNIMEEFKNWNISDIIDSIGDISVRKKMVNPGFSNLGKIVGVNTVDIVPGEGEVRYDIRFTVQYGIKQIRVLINLEAQKSTDVNILGYHIENRIQYYLARMISAQKNTEFVNDNYDGIRKVVSIWICMDAKDDCDGITKYSFKPESLYGKDFDYAEFDKMEAYIIRIRKNDDVLESKNNLIHMLEALLSKKKSDEVKRLLSEEHGMIMNVDGNEKEVEEMCNLGEGIYEDGIEAGKEIGKEIGMEQLLINLISSKLKKGMDTFTIAKELEQDENYIIELIQEHKLAKI